METFTAREFNQDVGRAKRAAESGPVVITDRGRPSHVLLTVDAYRRLAGETGATAGDTIADRLYWPGAAEVDLPLTRSREPIAPAEFD